VSRLDAIRTAARPKMHGRALISGPSGAGKTWTSLSMASVLAEGDMTRVLMIDTERESALTYADVFPGFAHLPWRPPFDPTELCDTLDKLGDQFAVVDIDSLSHFWRSQGGTLDIADGKIGGWKTARPVQERLVQSLLGVNAHLLLCVRSKMEYLIEGGRTNQTVTKLGMAPIQDDTLVYEVNIALDIDLEHRITVTKSRTPAVPVGRMYPAGLERKAAEDYAGWLAGGVPPASRDDVDSVVAQFGEIVDAEARARAKTMFVELFGMPHSLTAEMVAEARAWLTEHLATAAAQGTEPAPAPASDGAGEEPAPPGPSPDPIPDEPEFHDGNPDDEPARPPLEPDDERPRSLRDVATRSDLAFHRAGEEQRANRAKTTTLERLRHALILLVTGGQTASLTECDATQLAAVWARLGDICEGRTTYRYDADDNGYVTFEEATGGSETITWADLDAQPEAVPA
jgi:hypothetical protein